MRARNKYAIIENMLPKNISRLTLEITNRCDLSCKICDIWQEKKKEDLKLPSIARIISQLKNPVAVSLTGGEPLLHPEFDKIYRYLFALYLKKKVLTINVSTNAYSPKIKKFIMRNFRFLKPLTITISLDGLSLAHNRQRGKPDSFPRTLKNIDYIRKNQLSLDIKFTITPDNYRDLSKVYLLSKRIGAGFKPKIVEQNNLNYYHRNKEGYSLNFTDNQLKNLKVILNKIYKNENAGNKNSLRIFALSSMRKFLKERNYDFITACRTPQKALFICPEGEIFACLYYPAIGRVTKKETAINQKRYKKILQEAARGKCPKCLAYHGFLMNFNLGL